MDSKQTDNRLLKTANILILGFLVVITALLILLQFKLNQVLTQGAPPPAAQHPNASSEPTPNPAPPPLVPSTPVVASSVRHTPTPPVPHRHYTQPESKTAPAKPDLPSEERTPVATAAPPVAPPQPSLVLPPSSQPIVPAPAKPEPKLEAVTVPSGTVVTVRLINTLNSQQSRPGDRFTAALEEPISSSSGVVAPRGSTVEGKVIASREAGRVSGLSEMTLELDRLMLSDGRSLDIVTDALTKQGEASRGKDVATVGAGTAIGAAIGAIAGGRRGAGIGAATGAGAGTADVLLTRGKPVVLPAETRLSFRLRAPLQTEIMPGGSPSVSSEPPPESSPNSSWGRERPRLRRR